MKKIYLALFLTLFLVTAAFAEVNINTATLKELDSLTGIGSVKAEAIIKYRKDKGLFKDIHDLKNVKGIGEKTFEKIKEDITVGTTTKTEVKKAEEKTPKKEEPEKKKTTEKKK